MAITTISTVLILPPSRCLITDRFASRFAPPAGRTENQAWQSNGTLSDARTPPSRSLSKNASRPAGSTSTFSTESILCPGPID